MSFLHVDHVTHTYFSLKRKTTAVKDIHFDAEKGDFISFLGPSGCGKTTLLSIIAGIISPSEGQVLIEGQEPNQKNTTSATCCSKIIYFLGNQSKIMCSSD